MDGLKLLQEAKAAGLAVSVDGDKLVIRGPRKAEAIAKLLLEHKPAVIEALQQASRQHDQADAAPCLWCRRASRWLSVYRVEVCGECHPPAPGALLRWLEPQEN
jgi:hypothetical protein